VFALARPDRPASRAGSIAQSLTKGVGALTAASCVTRPGYRIGLVGVRTAEKNRVDKLLEDACPKLSVVASDIFGVSGRAKMAALIAGERDPTTLAELARCRMRTKIGRLEEAFADASPADAARAKRSSRSAARCW
jgi:hypothetical protein